MENKAQNFYSGMCSNCQQKFKKIINLARKNSTKTLAELEVFFCRVDKSRNINEDNGVIPLAFIFCKNDSYAFFWKDSLYNGDGSPKISLIDNTIILSQDTIEKIRNYSNLINIPSLPSKTHGVTNKGDLNKINSQISWINRQHLIQMTKMRKLFIIFGLIFILLIGSLGGFLGWYFLGISNLEPPIFDSSKIRLEDHLINDQLESLDDNKEQTILLAAKKKNNKLEIKDLLVKEITANSALIYVKSASRIYQYNTFAKVLFSPKKITIKTDVKIQNFYLDLDNISEDTILSEVKLENKDFIKSGVNVQNIKYIDKDEKILKADLVAKKNNIIYLDDDQLTVYFSTTGKKMLGQDLVEYNLGDIKNVKSPTILQAAKRKNPNLIVEEIEIINSIFEKNEIVVKVKEDSEYYINDNLSFILNYRVFNLNVGTVKNKSDKVLNNGFLTSLVRVDSQTILGGGFREIYQLSNNGEIKKIIRLPDISGNIYTIAKIDDDNILTADGKTIYKLNFDGSIREKVNQPEGLEFDGDVAGIIKLSDNRILTITAKSVYEINSTGEIIKKIDQVEGTEFDGQLLQIIELKNKSIFVLTPESIYSLNFDGRINEKIIQPIDQNFSDRVYSITQINEMTILVGGSEEVYQLDLDGQIRNKVKDKIRIEGNIFALLTLDNGSILAAATDSRLYQLHGD
ncbi:hypothetical protein SSYRP_v1c01530 [Spiroplasma syrphidicola EA-1]|uniref:Uncharacterized protein n=1 Tax=Spiroplasma syrphidicola EA-1 TaxID=1276229 RepID=R4UCY2_9MOLU|nr:hypothetical protein [Spiroplasma syrphidicola]AGM25749.1 hypothetical protein SSYRP_v1c01530 [Spiroplasma syrphidicola EA-1]